MELRKREHKQAEIPTSSMADIAFLLIVFFLVSTIFSSEMGLQIILPERGEEVKVRKSNLARVYVNEIGDVKIDGEPVKLDMIAIQAKAMLAENDSLIFSIKTNPQANYKYMVRVFDRLKQGGAERISFAPKTLPKK
ncbi:biopolymer transporter ExbD [candidate division WOR-3 bacterium]|nr:biopolymer transporter ExbD [candidate division WOR-3 bacterium]MCK4583956.1 biopolymer transporter ExbD [candidate division WOR-3 bacterium]TET78659.1 MAG: biopolymer transporter ExbD [Candidatus Cloacimonadota bacterium]